MSLTLSLSDSTSRPPSHCRCFVWGGASEALKSLSTMVSEVRADFFTNLESADADAETAKGSSSSLFGTQSEDGDGPFAGVPFARLDDSGNAQVNKNKTKRANYL